MNKKVLYLALGVALMGTTSCNKKLGDFQSNYFNTTPTPLETVGMNVPATITGNIPAKFMRKNAKVTATPVLEYAGGSACGKRNSCPARRFSALCLQRPPGHTVFPATDRDKIAEKHSAR